MASCITLNDVASSLVEGDHMAVVDIASAHRSVPIFPEHSQYQEFRWDFDDGRGEVYLRENWLCFGLKCAPFIFNLLSSLVVDMAKSEGVTRIVNYLDDFLVTESTSDECRSSRDIIIAILRRLGFAVSWKKVSPPSTCTTFLGICIDSEKMNLSLPDGKIDKLTHLIDDLKSSGSASKKQLESLGGLVSHFSSVIRGGRTFCRRIFDLSSACRRGRRVILSDEIRLDLEWWRKLCSFFNGNANIIGKEVSTSIVTDASSTGFGGWSEGDWFLGLWDGNVPECFHFHEHVVEPPSDIDGTPSNINIYELFAVLAGLRRWGPMVKDSLIQVVTDNTQVMHMVNTGRSSSKACMSWLREIFWLCFVFNVDLHAVYINTKENVFADALSRVSDLGLRKKAQDTICNLNLCCHDLIQSHLEGNWQQGKAN